MTTAISSMAATFRELAQYDWRYHARPNQLAPAGAWSVWLILAGRGFGKTRTGAEWVRDQMCVASPLAAGRCRHMALVGETAADVRDVMVGDGKGPGDGSGLLQVHPKDFRPVYESSKRRLTWPNGAIASIYNATEPEQLRGPQHDGAWCDELAKFALAQDVWDQLQFGLRLGPNPRVVVTTTPKPTKLLRSIMTDDNTIVTRGRTVDNAANLSSQFITTILSKYEGTRLGRQELDAEVLEDTPGALFKLADIDAARIGEKDLPPLRRIVVAIDPAVSNSEVSDETGIIVAGVDHQGNAYVLEDASLRDSPKQWARAAIAVYHRRRADRVVAEVNNGGALVEATLRMVDPNVSYKAVHASRGKALRAEPISALYEQHRVHHVGNFPKLEDQMCAFTSDYDRAKNGSPDRMDALVWAITELMVEVMPGWGMMEFYRLEAEKIGVVTANGVAATMVKLRAPPGAECGTIYLRSGSKLIIGADGVATVTPDDAKSLLATGWTTIQQMETENL